MKAIELRDWANLVAGKYGKEAAFDPKGPVAEFEVDGVSVTFATNNSLDGLTIKVGDASRRQRIVRYHFLGTEVHELIMVAFIEDSVRFVRSGGGE